MDMVLESMRLNFQMVSQYGARRIDSGFMTFAGGVIGGKHTFAVNVNSLGPVDILTQFDKMMQVEFNK